ncbi:MAG: phage head closure protein [Acutalibacteraceae bacterium]
MNIALLNVRITVQKNTVTVDNIGNHKNEWTDYYSCYATVSNETPTEITAAGTVTDNSKIDFTVRCCNILSGITSDRYRVIFGGGIYDIIGIDHMNFKKKMLKIKCQKARR